ncbi:MAG: DNA polymerase III subunit alpha, partial [Phycisphaerae bacterium]
EANKLTKLIPNDLKMTLDKAIKQEPELKKKFETDDQVKKILTIGKKLEGGARNAGVHAAGVVVADKDLTNFLPLYKAPGQDTIVTQFDGPTVEKVGLLKMDFLGLRTLTTLERARQLAMQSSGENIELNDIPLDDPKVYELFARGDTKGIFQFESGGMRDVLLRMRPNRIEDLIAANALYRPGPMEYIPDYVARKHGQSWTTPHAIMTEVLEETYGIMVYQEQVSRMVNRLGGIELKKAFRLAKAISKKKTAMIDAMREPFIEGCAKNGVAKKVAEEVFADILKFGGYAFNKAHSTGYAIVAYQTGWMKTYYPVEFMAALMTFEMSSTDKVAEYREACEQMGISIEPPDVNVSEFDFAVGRDQPAEASPKKLGTIHFGLGAIKGVGEKAVQAIVAERREKGRYKDIFDFCERVDLSAVNRSTVDALICAGAFDSTGAMRKALVEILESALASGQTAQTDRKRGQMSLFGMPAADDAPVEEGPMLSTAEWTEAEMLAREKAVLGFYITAHPLASCAPLLETCATASTVDLVRYGDGDPVVLGGMVSSLRTVIARGGRNPGRKLGILTIEDLAGRVEGIVFPDDLGKYQGMLVPDSVIFVQGEVDRKREEPSLRIEKIVSKDRVLPELTKALLIDIDAMTPLDRLISCFNAHRGKCPVFLNVPTQDGQVAQVECNPQMRVSCEAPFLVELAELVGLGNIRPIGPRRRVIAERLPTREDLERRQAEETARIARETAEAQQLEAGGTSKSREDAGWSQQAFLIDGV